MPTAKIDDIDGYVESLRARGLIPDIAKPTRLVLIDGPADSLIKHIQPTKPTAARTTVLPMPPSANRLWRSVVINKRARVLKSKEYHKWIEQAKPIAAKMGMVASPVGIAMTVHACHRGSDLDNRLKAVQDLLRFANVIEGDTVKHVQKVTIDYSPDTVNGGPGVLVSVWHLEN